jgi:glycosyltransferase involved in cell wall biosynthesis
MDFVFVANAWAAGAANPTSKHRIAIELARRGHRLLWVDGAGMRTPSLSSGSDRGRIARRIAGAMRGAVSAKVNSGQRTVNSGQWTVNSGDGTGGVWVVAPLFLPLPKHAAVRRFNGWVCRVCAGKWARRLGMREPVLVNYVPVLHDAMRGWSGLKVYHCVDRWDAFAMYDSSVMAAGDEQCCRLADRIIASSRDLESRCRRFNANVRLITHGVDHAHFSVAVAPGERPHDLPAGQVAGFFGLLSEWVDQDLLLMAARSLPDAHFVLIGQPDVSVDRLRGARNIHLLGVRPFSALPAYVAGFGVGMIPFAVNDLTRAVNPIKLREMLAAGCPVVSTNLPEVAPYAGEWVDVVATADEFVARIASRLANAPGLAERAAISNSVAGETWAAKVDEMLEWIGETVKGEQ